MNEVSLLQALGQVSASESGHVFREFLRGHVREMIGEVVAAEVSELCGPKHDPASSEHYRAATSPGRVLYEGEREEVVRPRVRSKAADGTSQEVELATSRDTWTGLGMNYERRRGRRACTVVRLGTTMCRCHFASSAAKSCFLVSRST